MKGASTFFEEIGSTRFVPRSVMIDLEPGVINSIQSSTYGGMFNPETMISGNNGAGNCWAAGFYSEGSEIIEESMSIVAKSAEKCDSLEGLNLTHSLGGGTGSGLGSLLIKEIRSEFYDKLLNSYSVFPSLSTSSIVVEPYNTVLAMNHLIEDCDLSIVLDNEAMYKIMARQFKNPHPSFHDINKLIQQSILTTTSSM